MCTCHTYCITEAHRVTGRFKCIHSCCGILLQEPVRGHKPLLQLRWETVRLLHSTLLCRPARLAAKETTNLSKAAGCRVSTPLQRVAQPHQVPHADAVCLRLLAAANSTTQLLAGCVLTSAHPAAAAVNEGSAALPLPSPLAARHIERTVHKPHSSATCKRKLLRPALPLRLGCMERPPAVQWVPMALNHNALPGQLHTTFLQFKLQCCRCCMLKSLGHWMAGNVVDCILY